MLRVTVETRHAHVDSPAADYPEAIALALDQVRTMVPLSVAREQLLTTLTEHLRAGQPVHLHDPHLGVTVNVQ